jgi:tyrosinase
MPGKGSAFVRREVWSLKPDDPIITYYGKAVKAMRERPQDKPTSWTYQAAIHGTEATGKDPLWNQCQHGTWFFLPWHRMFLYHFEEIVRAAVIDAGGPADWALPYWNYGLGGRHAKLPLAFRRPKLSDGDPNPLYVSERAPGINSGASLPTIAISPAKALARRHFIGAAEFGGGITEPGQFWSRTGRLEDTPHNAVHGFVGGREGLMGNILAAALDPIFWLHHANIDRLWSVWSEAPGHADPAQPKWRGQSFRFFDKHGHEVAMKCGKVLETKADLGYIYDTAAGPPAAAAPAAPPPGPAPAAAMKDVEPQMIGASEQSLELTGVPASVAVRIDREAAAAAKDPSLHVYLNVEDIEGESNPGTVYGIYADLPPDAPPDLEPAYHVGNLSFFGIDRARDPRGDEHGHGLRVAVDITGLARDLEARDEWAGHELTVTFRPLTLNPPEVPDEEDLVSPPDHEDTPIRIGRVSVFSDA